MTTHTACSACRLAETAARTAWIAGHVHQVRPGQWVVAQHGSVRYYASRASAVRSARQQIEWEMDSAICSEHRAQINDELDAERDREAAEIERTWRVSV